MQGPDRAQRGGPRLPVGGSPEVSETNRGRRGLIRARGSLAERARNLKLTLFYRCPATNKPCKYNADTRQQMWMSVCWSIFMISFCSCWHPFAHLLDSIFPEGHTDRHKPIAEIIARDSQCHSGGDGEESHGMALGSSAATLTAAAEGGPEDTPEDIENLIAAVEDAERR